MRVTVYQPRALSETEGRELLTSIASLCNAIEQTDRRQQVVASLSLLNKNANENSFKVNRVLSGMAGIEELADESGDG